MAYKFINGSYAMPSRGCIHRNTAAVAAAFLFCLSCNAFGATVLYKGELEIIETSGGSCNAQPGSKGEIKLALRWESEDRSIITGFFNGDQVKMRKFKGSSLTKLTVSRLSFDDLKGQEHSLSIALDGDMLTGELREKHLQPTDKACNLDLARLKLKRVGDGSDAEKEFLELAARFDSAALNSEGDHYRNAMRYAEAEALYKRALEIRESGLGKDHTLVASSLDDLAYLYRTTGRYAEAETFCKRALDIYETRLGKDHSSVADALNNLGGVYRSTGRYVEAEPVYKRALGIREARLGKGHIDTAASLNDLALLYRETERYAEAEPLFVRALAITEATLGGDHPDVATNLNNLALIYRETGRYKEAEPLYKRALQIRESRFGNYHHYVANSLNNLAGLQFAQGRYDQAGPLFKRAFCVAQSNPLPNLLRDAQNNYAYFLFRLGHLRAAIFFAKLAVNSTQDLRRDVSKMGKEALKDFQKTVEHMYRRLSSFLSAEGRLSEARQVMDLLKQEDDAISGKVAFTGLEAALEGRYRHAAESLEKLGRERELLLHEKSGSSNEEARLTGLNRAIEPASEDFLKVIDEIVRELSAQGE